VGVESGEREQRGPRAHSHNHRAFGECTSGITGGNKGVLPPEALSGNWNTRIPSISRIHCTLFLHVQLVNGQRDFASQIANAAPFPSRNKRTTKHVLICEICLQRFGRRKSRHAAGYSG
jgi:hypothetical protein